MKIRW